MQTHTHAHRQTQCNTTCMCTDTHTCARNALPHIHRCVHRHARNAHTCTQSRAPIGNHTYMQTRTAPSTHKQYSRARVHTVYTCTPHIQEKLPTTHRHRGGPTLQAARCTTGGPPPIPSRDPELLGLPEHLHFKATQWGAGRGWGRWL